MRELGEAVNGLALSLNPKTAIHPWQRGIDFCGYRIWPTHILPRKRNIKRARADFRQLMTQYFAGEVDLPDVRQRVMSFLAYAKHCQAHRTVEGVLGDLVLDTGLRMKEAYTLRVSQIDFARGFINVEGSKGHRGSAKPRTVPLKPGIATELHQRVQRHAVPINDAEPLPKIN